MPELNRRDPPAEVNDLRKTVLKPAFYDQPGSVAKTGNGGASRVPPPPSVSGRDASSTAAAVPDSVPAVAMPSVTDIGGSKLFVGVDIKLKGAEISDCDVLVIEGDVAATINSKVMQIEKPGTFTGTAVIDFAEIHGQFTGDLTARTRLIVHGTGRISGTIRYGKLVVAEGGELSGDVRRLDDFEAAASIHNFDPRNVMRSTRSATFTRSELSDGSGDESSMPSAFSAAS